MNYDEIGNSAKKLLPWSFEHYSSYCKFVAEPHLLVPVDNVAGVEIFGGLQKLVHDVSLVDIL